MYWLDLDRTDHVEHQRFRFKLISLLLESATPQRSLPKRKVDCILGKNARIPKEPSLTRGLELDPWPCFFFQTAQHAPMYHTCTARLKYCRGRLSHT
jgi:hypothetical protein